MSALLWARRVRDPTWCFPNPGITVNILAVSVTYVHSNGLHLPVDARIRLSVGIDEGVL
jgi:hypothetical protein